MLLTTSALARRRCLTAPTRYNHQRNGRTCARVVPTPCPTRLTECSTATVKVVHLVVFLLVLLLSVHSTSCQLAGSGELVAALAYLLFASPTATSGCRGSLGRRTSPGRYLLPTGALHAHIAGPLALPDVHSVAAESHSSIQRSLVQTVGLEPDVTPAVSSGLLPWECLTFSFLCRRALVSLPSAPAAVDSFPLTVLL